MITMMSRSRARNARPALAGGGQAGVPVLHGEGRYSFAVDIDGLIAELTDPDEETRAAAREELDLVMDDGIAQTLLDIAGSDAADEIRADAVVAFGPLIEECGNDYGDGPEFDFEPDLGPPVSRETFAAIVRRLGELYADEGQATLVRRRAFEVLIRDPQPWHAAEIRKLFSSDDEEWRTTAVFAMGHIKGFASELAATVERAEGALLSEAVRAAGSMEVAAAAPRIRALATSANADLDLRLEAIHALPGVDPDCFELLDEMTRSRNRAIADAADEALSELSLREESADFDDDDDDGDGDLS
jgi:hypothetical protein